MPARRTQRRETIAEPLALLSALRPGRDAICRACATVRPTGEAYAALSGVLDAMSALAAHLSHPDYFLDEVHRTPKRDGRSP